MPITFPCPCGKTLRVNDGLAGRWVRCPACRETAMVPEAEPQPAFEVVEDEPPAPPLARPRPRAEPDAGRYEDDDPPPRPKRRTPDRDDDEDDRPRRPRPRRKARPAREEKPSHFGFEKRILSGGVIGGLAAMVGAAIWFVVGLQADRIFFYPPVLFVLGLIGVVKGLVGGGDE